MTQETDNKELFSGGKWKTEYHYYPDDGLHICVAKENGDWVADCGIKGNEEAEANAALIASTPRLKALYEKAYIKWGLLKAENEKLKAEWSKLYNNGALNWEQIVKRFERVINNNQ